jgi:hypothetical protein
MPCAGPVFAKKEPPSMDELAAAAVEAGKVLVV